MQKHYYIIQHAASEWNEYTGFDAYYTLYNVQVRQQKRKHTICTALTMDAACYSQVTKELSVT